MKHCAYCQKGIGLVEYKRWGDLCFCSKVHLQDYCKERQQEDRISSFLAWLSDDKFKHRQGPSSSPMSRAAGVTRTARGGTVPTAHATRTSSAPE